MRGFNHLLSEIVTQNIKRIDRKHVRDALLPGRGFEGDSFAISDQPSPSSLSIYKEINKGLQGSRPITDRTAYVKGQLARSRLGQARPKRKQAKKQQDAV